MAVPQPAEAMKGLFTAQFAALHKIRLKGNPGKPGTTTRLYSNGEELQQLQLLKVFMNRCQAFLGSCQTHLLHSRFNPLLIRVIENNMFIPPHMLTTSFAANFGARHLKNKPPPAAPQWSQ